MPASEVVQKQKRSKFNPAIVDDSTKDLRRALWILALPAVGEMLLNTTVGMIDTAMVGRIGKEAVAAVGLANRFVNLILGVFMAITTGTTATVARYYGAERKQEASDVLRQSLLAAVFFALILGIPSYLFAKPLIRSVLTSGDAIVFEGASTYFRVMAASFIFLFLNLTSSSALRGTGDMSAPLVVVGLTNVVNFIGNYLLIYGNGPFPRLGIYGAALSTLISRAIGTLVYGYMIIKGRGDLTINWRKGLKFSKELLAPVFKIGIPAAVEQLVMRTGQFLYYFVIIGLGTAAQAAHEVALNAESISYNPGFGFALAATTMVGQFLGAGKPDHAMRSGKEAAKINMWIMSTIGVFFFLFPSAFVRLFVPNDPEVIELASMCLRIVAISEPFFAAVMVFAGGLRGAGDTLWVMVSTILGVWVVRLGLAFLFVNVMGFGLAGAWWAMNIDLMVRSILLWYRFRSGKWQNIKI
ncbi:MAG: MATE family efflux transporter [Firmicutes bacterium]|nr:MATE family efflux transporter [Bacillota bacterium]MDD4263162.1 MATE family efflux transporter [Bacillota bacterium]MDD4693208.1 MATE family efflux transporter [Bacillota bacterium]